MAVNEQWDRPEGQGARKQMDDGWEHAVLFSDGGG